MNSVRAAGAKPAPHSDVYKIKFLVRIPSFFSLLWRARRASSLLIAGVCFYFNDAVAYYYLWRNASERASAQFYLIIYDDVFNLLRYVRARLQPFVCALSLVPPLHTVVKAYGEILRRYGGCFFFIGLFLINHRIVASEHFVRGCVDAA
jgi:hypothetical protein